MGGFGDVYLDFIINRGSCFLGNAGFSAIKTYLFATLIWDGPCHTIPWGNNRTAEDIAAPGKLRLIPEGGEFKSSPKKSAPLKSGAKDMSWNVIIKPCQFNKNNVMNLHSLQVINRQGCSHSLPSYRRSDLKVWDLEKLDFCQAKISQPPKNGEPLVYR